MEPVQQALFEAVYDAPDDDDPRETLARALRDRGDPRGELIELQLRSARAGRVGREEATRIRELLGRHGAEWLHQLGGALVARSVKWDRGFPVTGRLAFQKSWTAQEAGPKISRLIVEALKQNPKGN